MWALNKCHSWHTNLFSIIFFNRWHSLNKHPQKKTTWTWNDNWVFKCVFVCHLGPCHTGRRIESIRSGRWRWVRRRGRRGRAESGTECLHQPESSGRWARCAGTRRTMRVCGRSACHTHRISQTHLASTESRLPRETETHRVNNFRTIGTLRDNE